MRFFTESSRKLATLSLLFVSIIFPVIALPLGDSFLIESKVFLFLLVTVFIAGLWTVSSLLKKTIQFTLSPFLLPLLSFGITTIVSSLLNGTTSMFHLLGIGGIYVASAALVIFGSSLVEKKSSNIFVHALLIPALLVSFASLAETLHFGPSLLVNSILRTRFPNSTFFTIVGSPLLASQFLGLILVGIIALLATAKDKTARLLYVFPGLIVVMGLILNLDATLKIAKTSPIGLSYQASYYIAIDTFKSAKSAFIGVGPEGFVHSYLHNKPGFMNLTPAWSINYTQASNFPFTIAVTLGLAGLFSWLFLVVQSVRKVLNTRSESIPAASIFLATLLLQLLLPINIITLGIQALALIFWIASEKDTLKDIQVHAFTVQITQSNKELQKVPKHSNFMVYVITGFCAVIIAISAYWFTRLTVANFFVFRASLASVENNPIKVYDMQRLAIQAQPYSDALRRNYSLTNLQLALAIANSKEASKEDKDKVALLIQQAIREAKVAANIDPENNANWFTLAAIYENLIGSVKGAEEWTISAYNLAIQVSPNDPTAHLNMGAVFYKTGNYAQSTQLFEKAVILKPDWPSAYYSLANSYKQEKKYSQALMAYNDTLKLIVNNSEEYAKVKKEADEVQALAEKEKQPAGDEKTKPKQEVVLPKPPENSANASGSSEIKNIAPKLATPSSTIPDETKKTLEQSDLEKP